VMGALVTTVARRIIPVLCALGPFLFARVVRGQPRVPYAPVDPARFDAGARPQDSGPLEEHAFGRVRYALQTEPAFGVVGGSFYNQLAGARVDYRFTEQIALGGYLGYANLKGKEGRAHDVLSYLNLEYRPRLDARGAFGLPLAFGSGYLPNNGPFLRLSAAVSYALSRETDVVFAFLTPTFWVVHDRTVVSLGAALEISYAP
jgi:hypothetical protein